MPSPSRTTAALHGRQDGAATPSSINWWPYPSYSAWGQTTYAVGTTPDATPALASSLVSAPAHAVSLMTTSYSDDSITMPTSLLSPSSSSVTSSAPLVLVTALPPASSESSIERVRARMAQKGSSSFNIIYLAPLFGILGALAGGLLTWLLYRCLPAHREHEVGLVPGPVYNPPTIFRQVRPATLLPPEIDARRSMSSTQELVAEKSVEEPNRGSWLGRAFTRTSSNKISGTKAPRSHTSGSEEDDPFLDDSSPTGTPSASSRRGTRTSGDSRSCQVTSPDPYGALSDADDTTPYESLRHKSIRRGILERLRSSTLRRSKGTYKLTQTSDNNSDRTNSESNSATPVQRRRGHRRAGTDTSRASTSDQDGDETPSCRHTLSRNSSQCISSPSGFRIVVEDPESGALLEEDEAYSSQASPTPRPKVKRQKSDKFTPAPIRRSTDEKRNSPFVSPSKAGSPSLAQGVQGITRVDSSILPMSPPLVTSPPLESQLFFGAMSPSLVLLRSAPAVSVKTVVNAMEKGTDDDGKQHKKLRTQREPPLLPFPSTASTSPYRGRLKKAGPQPQAQSRPVAERADSGVSSSSSDSAYSQATTATNGKVGRGTAAERYLARKTALSKVDEILSRSWSERQLAGETCPGGPNKFGAALQVLPAVPGEESADEKEKDDEAETFLGMGIEQRLAAFRG